MSARSGPRWLVAGVSLVAVAAIATGLWVIGSPAHQRALRLDQVRSTHLEQLAGRVSGYWSIHKALPPTLDSVVVEGARFLDPQTGQPYGYSITGATTYRLCAHFDTASEQDGHGPGEYVPPYPDRWSHPPGLHCFDRDARPKGDGAL